MFFKRISFRIGIAYAVASLISSLLLFALTAFLLVESLQRKDHVLLNEKIQEYAALFARDGVKGLRLRTSSQQIKDAQSFVVRLADPSGKTIFLYSPDRSHDHDAPTLEILDKALTVAHGKNDWLVVPGGGYGDDVEVVSMVLPTRETLQVGKDTEDREAFLQSFAHAYFLGLIPILILALLVGGFLSRRLLSPIRWLTQTVESVRSGNPKARVPLRDGSGDELWRLGTLFNQMLEQNDKLLLGMRDALDNVAHDLRTPIMRLQNSVEGALRGTKDLALYEEALIDCQENSELILKLINDILDIAEADAGKLALKRETFGSEFLIDSVIDLYGFVAEEKGIALATSQVQKFSLSGDRMRLLQVISNLVDNAIKYSPAGTTVTIESKVVDGLGMISVIDQGSGIPENEITKIWDRLYRIDASRSSRGLGLGLSLVKAIVSAHGGRSGVINNSSGVGSTFFVKFPLSS